MSEEQEAPPPFTGRAKGWVNFKPWKKGQSGNKSGRPKDLGRLGEILMKEFYKTVAANLKARRFSEGLFNLYDDRVRLPNAMPGSTLS